MQLHTATLGVCMFIHLRAFVTLMDTQINILSVVNNPVLHEPLNRDKK